MAMISGFRSLPTHVLKTHTVDVPVLPVKADVASLSGTPVSKAPAAAPPAVDPTQDAQEIPGMFKLLQKDDKVWFSIRPEQLNKPFFFSANISKSIGEKGMVGSEMGESQMAEFRRSGNMIQLVARHTSNFATPGTPQGQFVSEDFSDSLLASAPITAGAKRGDELVVEANALLFTDIPAYSARLEGAYQTPFSLDVKNTNFAAIDNSEQQSSFGVQAHYTSPNVPKGSLPSTTPEGRSLLTEFRYNFAKLPDVPMTPRLADDRIGHFVTSRKDYDGDDGDGKVRFVNRWRLEKQDPNAPLSAPVQPITYWVAKDVPQKYRESVREGILEWNKAFERIGFHNAIEVKQQSDADKFDTMDARHASVRWYTAADVGSAVGPSQVDPRTGEILDADIRMADVFARSARRTIADFPPETHSHDGHECHYLHHAGQEQHFASALLEARGEPGDLGEKLAQAYVKDVVMHEVGHTLGLRHNFKGSLINTQEQLQDAEYTRANGMGSSVMDYQPFNLALPGEKQGEYVMSGLGEYDYLAVQYAYQPLPAEREKDILASIAAQTTSNPRLNYESDEAADASDPEVNRFDLGNDPLEFAEKQVALGRELWDRAQNRVLPDGADYQQLTKAFSAGLSKLAGSARFMARYIGGVTLRRDHAGTENATYTPVPAEKQRKALHSLMTTYFQPDSFKFKPEFLARLAKDRFDNWGDQNMLAGQAVLKTQSSVIAMLLDKNVAQRVISNPEKLPEGTPTFQLSELYDTLQNTIWSELSSGSEISQSRRDLQREHLKAVVPFLAADANVPGEAASLMRYELSELKEQIDQALAGAMNIPQRAHLQQCSQTLSRALNPDK